MKVIALGPFVAALLFAVSVSATESTMALSVEFPKVGDVCLQGDDLTALRTSMKGLVVPAGSAITLVSFSDLTEATRKRPGLTSDCIAHLVPEGIKAHQRIAVFRALQVAELGQELGIDAFNAAPLLVIGSESYRQVDADGIAIVSARADGSTPHDRRVEVWVTPGRAGGGPAATGGTVILTPILLPPAEYGSGRSTGPSASGAPGSPRDSGETRSGPKTGSSRTLRPQSVCIEAATSVAACRMATSSSSGVPISR